MAKRATHIPGEPKKTLCGKWIHAYEVQTNTMFRAAERDVPLAVIGKNDLIDSATCKACQRADDARQVRDYKRECAAAGLDPVTGRKP